MERIDGSENQFTLSGRTIMEEVIENRREANRIEVLSAQLLQELQEYVEGEVVKGSSIDYPENGAQLALRFAMDSDQDEDPVIGRVSVREGGHYMITVKGLAYRFNISPFRCRIYYEGAKWENFTSNDYLRVLQLLQQIRESDDQEQND